MGGGEKGGRNPPQSPPPTRQSLDKMIHGPTKLLSASNIGIFTLVTDTFCSQPIWADKGSSGFTVNLSNVSSHHHPFSLLPLRGSYLLLVSS